MLCVPPILFVPRYYTPSQKSPRRIINFILSIWNQCSSLSCPDVSIFKKFLLSWNSLTLLYLNNLILLSSWCIRVILILEYLGMQSKQLGLISPLLMTIHFFITNTWLHQSSLFQRILIYNLDEEPLLFFPQIVHQYHI